MLNVCYIASDIKRGYSLSSAIRFTLSALAPVLDSPTHCSSHTLQFQPLITMPFTREDQNAAANINEP